jgi:hypothetical protein
MQKKELILGDEEEVPGEEALGPCTAESTLGLFLLPAQGGASPEQRMTPSWLQQ